MIDESKMAAELEQIVAAYKAPQDGNTDATFNKQISNVLNQAAEAGLKPLMDSLNQQGGEPPQAVKKMIKGLMKDFDLGEGATTEDLLSTLVEQMSTNGPGKSSAKKHRASCSGREKTSRGSRNIARNGLDKKG